MVAYPDFNRVMYEILNTASTSSHQLQLHEQQQQLRSTNTFYSCCFVTDSVSCHQSFLLIISSCEPSSISLWLLPHRRTEEKKRSENLRKLVVLRLIRLCCF